MKRLTNRRLRLDAIMVASAVVIATAGCTEPTTKADDSIQSTAQSTATHPTDRIIIDLGTVPAGTRVERTISLSNSSSREWSVARVETSCECLVITPSRAIVAPGEFASLNLVADFGLDPSYTGKLLIICNVLGSTSELLSKFSLAIDVEGSEVIDADFTKGL